MKQLSPIPPLTHELAILAAAGADSLNLSKSHASFLD
jgi:hypothetical protein